jgi:hypothetical protein
MNWLDMHCEVDGCMVLRFGMLMKPFTATISCVPTCKTMFIVVAVGAGLWVLRGFIDDMQHCKKCHCCRLVATRWSWRRAHTQNNRIGVSLACSLPLPLSDLIRTCRMGDVPVC